MNNAFASAGLRPSVPKEKAFQIVFTFATFTYVN
jgi:hypothetical protein